MKPTKPTDKWKEIMKVYNEIGETKRIILWCILIGFLAYVVAFQLGINQGIAISNQPPMQTYTLNGAIGYLTSFQMPIFGWGILFLFLWLTKW